MTIPEMPSTDGGSFVAVLFFESWPAGQDTIITAHELADGFVKLIGTSRGELCLEVIRKVETYEDVAQEITCCPIVMSAEARRSGCGIAVGWGQDGIYICVNGDVVASTVTPGEESNPKICHLRVRPTPVAKSYEKENQLAILKRRDRVAGWQSVPGRTKAGNDFVLSALQNEVLQLEDLLEFVRQGRIYHVAGIASRLRILIATGGSGAPLPLLQLAASITQEPLIVYTVANPELNQKRATQEDPAPVADLSSSISPVPVIGHSNLVDLDVWLDQYWGHIRRKTLTNRKLLCDFGNTIGSHIDLDMTPSVALSRSVTSEMGSAPHDFTASFLTRVAHVALQLGKTILRQHSIDA